MHAGADAEHASQPNLVLPRHDAMRVHFHPIPLDGHHAPLPGSRGVVGDRVVGLAFAGPPGEGGALQPVANADVTFEVNGADIERIGFGTRAGAQASMPFRAELASVVAG